MQFNSFFIDKSKTAQKGTICGDKFNDQSANDICREIGFRGAKNWTSGVVQSNYSAILSDVECEENSSSLEECSYNDEPLFSCNEGHAVHLSCISNNGINIQHAHDELNFKS